MKKQVLLFTAISGLLYLSLSSYQTGPTFKPHNFNCTEGPGSNGTCGTAGTGCHSGANTAMIGSAGIVVRAKSKGWGSAPVSTYQNDSVYLVTIVAKHDSLMAYGLQAEILDGNNASTGFITPKTHIIADSIGGKVLVAHDGSIPLTDSATFEWKASSADTSTVSFYGAVAIVDGSGSALDDSLKKLQTVTLTWAPPTNVNQVKNRSIDINAYPNPVTGNYLYLAMNNSGAGEYTVSAYGMNGQKIYQNSFTTHSSSADVFINTERWAKGTYIIHVMKGETQKTISVVKF